jgi:hypothetical protein
MKLRFFIAILFGCVWTTFAAPEGFSKYQIIINKHPFGKQPPAATVPQNKPPSESFAKDLRVTMIFEGPDGDMRAGIIDDKQGISYILKKGEIDPEIGIELIEADYATSEVELKKGADTVHLTQKKGPVQTVKNEPQKKPTSDYAKRREEMLAKIKAQKEKEQEERQPRLTGEALKKHLEEVQMDAIRTGKPPLPMPLTPEMDAQLVEEGILDPQ